MERIAPAETAPEHTPPALARRPATRRRPGPAPEDRALYSCACGFVFDHEVSTSVACPHCGDAQAW